MKLTSYFYLLIATIIWSLATPLVKYALNDVDPIFFLFFRFLLGLSYWCVNIFVRKLHEKNEPEDGWLLVPVWIFLPELCLFSLFVMYLSEKRTKFIERF